VQTAPQSSSEHLSVDDASVTPSSRKSSHRSRGEQLISPDDDSISDENSLEVTENLVMQKYHPWELTHGIIPIILP
jgi:hypothetical protein